MFWRKWKTRTSVPQLAPLLESWRLSVRHHDFSPGASDREINSTQEALKVIFPDSFRALYEFSNGFSLCGGNTSFYPLDGPSNALPVRHLNTMPPTPNWRVPEEVVLFGSDGSDGTFGLWLSTRKALVADSPVVEVGEGGGLALAATNLISFLRARTAYHLLLEEAPSKSLDALGVPQDLRTMEMDEDLFASILKWADPKIPNPRPDPYENRIAADEFRRQFDN